VKARRGTERMGVAIGTLKGRKLDLRTEGKRATDRAPAVDIVVRSILCWYVVGAEGWWDCLDQRVS
jgi:hypothetical protein